MRRRVIVITVIVAVLLIAGVVWRFRVTSQEAARPRPAPVVALGAPQPDTLTRVSAFTGDILPVQQATIYSRVSGNVEAMFVDIGSNVRRGQLLAMIDTTLYAQNVRQTYGLWRQADATAQNAKITRDRTKALFDKKLASQQDLDNSETALSVAVAQVEAAQANYRNAVTTLGYCRITAPFAGYITKRYLDPGAYVNNIPTAQTASLLTVMDIDTVRVMVNIVERDIPLLDSVSTVEVAVDGVPGRVFSGSIRRIGEALDPATRTLPVQVDIVNKDRALKPGMFATTRIILERKVNAPALPEEVVQTDDNGSFVYVVGPDSVARKRPVTTGITDRNKTEIVGGIAAGDRVVVAGQHLLRDGMTVRFKQ